jgi:hypothetical protein
MPFAQDLISVFDKKSASKNSFCPIFIRLSVPSWHGDFIPKGGGKTIIPKNTLKIRYFTIYCNILQFTVLSAYYGKNCKNRAVKYPVFLQFRLKDNIPPPPPPINNRLHTITSIYFLFGKTLSAVSNGFFICGRDAAVSMLGEVLLLAKLQT